MTCYSVMYRIISHHRYQFQIFQLSPTLFRYHSS